MRYVFCSDAAPTAVGNYTVLIRLFPPPLHFAEQYDNQGSDVATVKHRAGEDFQNLMAQAKDLANNFDMKFFDLA